MLPAFFALNPNSSLALGLEGLRCNLAAIGSTPPRHAAVSSIGSASVLAQGMEEGLSSKSAGQASGKWSVCLLHLLIVGNICELQGGGLGRRHCYGKLRGPFRQQ